MLDFCRAQGLQFILGLATSSTLRARVVALEHSTAARHASSAADSKLRRYKEFLDGAASWSRVERIIARVEASAQGTDTRFVVTNITGVSARTLYEDLYCRRGQAENHIKSWKTHLAADRTSCCRAAANQLRMMLHTGAYWLLWSPTRPGGRAEPGGILGGAGGAAVGQRQPGRAGHGAPGQRVAGAVSAGMGDAQHLRYPRQQRGEPPARALLSCQRCTTRGRSRRKAACSNRISVARPGRAAPLDPAPRHRGRSPRAAARPGR